MTIKSIILCIIFPYLISHVPNAHAINLSNYKSQFGQDKLANDNFFHLKRNGFFVDIGAHDGRTYSNSYFFEKELNWNGICIEPMPKAFAQLKNNRSCICINGAISDSPATKKFLEITSTKIDTEMLSGLAEKYDARHTQRINNEIEKYAGSTQTIDVQCYLLNDILHQYNIKHIDFLSIDTEGGEFDILISIDFNHIFIDVITIENNYKDDRIRQFLTQKGYIFVKQLACDEVYKKITYP